jgi:hypothetical protein
MPIARPADPCANRRKIIPIHRVGTGGNRTGKALGPVILIPCHAPSGVTSGPVISNR